MKKLALFLMIFALVFVTACSSGGGTESGSNSGGGQESGANAGGTNTGGTDNSNEAKGAGNQPYPVTDKEVTLSYQFWDVNQQPAMQKIVDEFNKIYPNIKIQLEVIPWDQYWVNLEAAATGGTLPDIFWINATNFRLYALNNQLLPLKERIEKENYSTANFPEPLLDLYTIDGEQYGFPKDVDTIGLWYNKELFDQAGLEYPNENWTWDDLIENAKALTNPEKKVWGFAAHISQQTNWYNTVYQAGGYVLNEDRTKAGHADPKSIEGLKLFTDMIHVHKASPTIGQMTDTEPRVMFESGNVAMIFDGSWNQIRFRDNEYTADRVDVTYLPQGPAGRATIVHGLANVIAKNTKHPNEAWAFLKFLGSERAAEIQGETGTVLPSYDSAMELWVKSNPKFNLQIFVDSLEWGVGYPTTVQGRKAQQIETDIFTKAWAGEISIEEAAQQVAEGVQAILDEDNAKYK